MELTSSFPRLWAIGVSLSSAMRYPVRDKADRSGHSMQIPSVPVMRRKVSPGRPPKAQEQAHRAHVLSVAAAEFIGHGFANANVARIARTAGVSNKTIYARYATKEALLLAVVAEIVETSRRLLVAEMAASSDDPEHVLLTFGLRIAKGWTSPKEVGLYRLIVSEAHRFPVLAEILGQQMEQLRDPLVAYLRDQADRGVFAIPHLEGAVRQFGLLVYGEARERALLGEKQNPEEIAATVRRGVRLFVKGYEAAAGGSA